MKRRFSRRFFAAMLAASVLAGQSGYTSFAGEPGVTEAPVSETMIETAPMASAEAPVTEMAAETAVEAAAEAPTDPPTEPPTDPPTEPPTDPPTEPPTDPPTEPPTDPPTEAPTDPPTEAPTDPPTEAPTDPPTEAPTDAPTEAPTDAPTEASAPVPTEAQTDAPTEAATGAPAETSAQIPGDTVTGDTTPLASTEGTTEAKGTEAATELTERTTDQTESETEKKTEDEEIVTEEVTEEVRDTTQLTGSIPSGTIVVALDGADAVTRKGNLAIETINAGTDSSSYAAVTDLIRGETDEGHHRLSGGEFYRIELFDGEEPVFPTEPVSVEITYNVPLSLGLAPYHHAEARMYADLIFPYAPGEGEAAVSLDGNLNAVAASYQGYWQEGLGVVGVCDHVNNGDTVTQDQLRAHISSLTSDHAIAAGSAEGTSNIPEEIAAGAGLGDLAAYSVQLANARSSGDVLVANVYADADGSIDWTGLTPALNGDSIDATNYMVLVNVIAASSGQYLSLTSMGISDQTTAGDAYSAEDAVRRKAGRVIYNFAAWEGDGFTSFTGTVGLSNAGTGVYLVPSGALDISGSGLRGSACVGTVVTHEETEILPSSLGFDPVAARSAKGAKDAEEDIIEDDDQEGEDKDKDKEGKDKEQEGKDDEKTDEPSGDGLKRNVIATLKNTTTGKTILNTTNTGSKDGKEDDKDQKESEDGKEDDKGQKEDDSEDLTEDPDGEQKGAGGTDLSDTVNNDAFAGLGAAGPQDTDTDTNSKEGDKADDQDEKKNADDDGDKGNEEGIPGEGSSADETALSITAYERTYQDSGYADTELKNKGDFTAEISYKKGDEGTTEGSKAFTALKTDGNGVLTVNLKDIIGDDLYFRSPSADDEDFSGVADLTAKVTALPDPYSFVPGETGEFSFRIGRTGTASLDDPSIVTYTYTVLDKGSFVVKQPTTLTIPVSIVGSDAPTTEQNGAKFNVSVGGQTAAAWTPDDSKDGKTIRNYTLTLDGNADTAKFLELYGKADLSADELKTSFKLTFTETAVPLFYQFFNSSSYAGTTTEVSQTATIEVKLSDFYKDKKWSTTALTRLTLTHPLATLTIKPAAVVDGTTPLTGTKYSDDTSTEEYESRVITPKTDSRLKELSASKTTATLAVRESTTPDNYICLTGDQTLTAQVNKDNTISWGDGKTDTTTVTAEPKFDHEKKDTTLAIPVSILGADSTTAQLNGAKFTVALGEQTEEWEPADSADGVTVRILELNLENYTAAANFLKLYRKQDPTAEELATTLTVKLTETRVPLFYNYFDASKEATVTIPLSSLYDAATKEWKKELTAAQLTLTHPLAVLTVEPVSDIAGTAYSDNAGGTNYTTRAITLKTTAPFGPVEGYPGISAANTSVGMTVAETTTPAAYLCVNDNQTLTAQLNGDNTITWNDGTTAARPQYQHLPKMLTVKMQANDGTYGLPATFMFRNSAGQWIADALGRTSVSSDGNVMEAYFSYDVGEVTVVQTGVPANYIISGSSSQTVTTVRDDYVYNPGDTAARAVAETYFANFTSPTSEVISVRKEWYVGSDQRFYNGSGDTVFHLALFSDAAKTNRVSRIYTVTAAKGNPYKTVRLKNLPAGTYYVGETDGYGVCIDGGSGNLTNVTYESDASGLVNIKSSGSEVHNVTIKNHYASLPAGGQYVGLLGIRKQVTLADGTLDTSFDGNVTVQIRYPNSAGKTVSQKKTLAVSKGKSAYTVFYVPLGTSNPSKEVTIFEAYTGTDGKTYYVQSGKKARLNNKVYDVSMSSPSAVITAAQASTPLVTVTNAQEAAQNNNTDNKNGTNNSGSNGNSSGGDASQAVLKLTKRVTYKGAGVRVNSGYYIGIFDDADLTKLRYKKALQFKNASEVSASLKINLYKLKSREVTFYFAEVDKDGKPVESGEIFGYNVSQNKQSITLNPSNTEDEVVFTNDVIQGSRREQQLTDASSGFAGDSNAVADAEAAAVAGYSDATKEANSSAATKTGDETPIGLLVGVMAAALVVIIAAVIIIRRRKRK